MENEYIDVPGGFELPTKEESKFIKLFEEYLVKYNSEYGPINCSINIHGITLMGIHESIIISKKFGFIDWLVKNDKIDLDKVEQEAMSWFDDESPVYGKGIRTARLIMMLSVSNNPISDLVYYFK